MLRNLNLLVFLLFAGCTQTPLIDGNGLPVTADQFVNKRRFDSVKIGSTQSDVERIYGHPTLWQLDYGNGRIAFFTDDKFTGALDLHITHWINEDAERGMSQADFEAKFGKAEKACMGGYYIDGWSHWFCFREGKLIDKERGIPPPA